MKPCLSVVCLALGLSACALLPDAGRAPQENPAAALIGHWVHAYEEDAGDGVQVYRPLDFYSTLPPSRFRKQYVFEQDGTCRWFYLAPDDAHHFRPGTWAFDPEREDVLHVREGDQTISFRLVELTGNMLRMVPLTEPESPAR